MMKLMRRQTVILSALVLLWSGAAPVAVEFQDNSGAQGETSASSGEEITRTESVTLLVHGMMKSRSGAT